MASRYEPFISDNPFRLLNLDSLTPFAKVRQKADQVSRQLAAGFPVANIPQDSFSTDALSQISETTRQLLTDTHKRTMHRLFWSQLEGQHIADYWIHFLTEPAHQPALASLLSNIETLRSDTEKAQPYIERLQDEESIDQATASKYFKEAITELSTHVVSRAAQLAVEAEESGSTDTLLEITSTILASPLDDSVEEKGIQPIVLYVDRIFSNLEAANPETTAYLVSSLISRIGSRHPCTRRWREQVDLLTELPAEALRKQAIALYKRRDYQKAIDLLKEALALAKSEEMRAQIAANIRGCTNEYIRHLRDTALKLANSANNFRDAISLLEKCLTLCDDEDVSQRIREDLRICRDNYAQVLGVQAGNLADKQDFQGAASAYRQAAGVAASPTLKEHLREERQMSKIIAEGTPQPGANPGMTCGKLLLIVALVVVGTPFVISFLILIFTFILTLFGK